MQVPSYVKVHVILRQFTTVNIIFFLSQNFWNRMHIYAISGKFFKTDDLSSTFSEAVLKLTIREMQKSKCPTISTPTAKCVAKAESKKSKILTLNFVTSHCFWRIYFMKVLNLLPYDRWRRSSSEHKYSWKDQVQDKGEISSIILQR